MAERFIVIGAGTMGAGIGYVAATRGFDVTVVDVDGTAARAALDRARDWAATALARQRIDADQATAVDQRMTAVTNVSELAPDPAVIVEAVPERVELKRSVLRDAEQLTPQLLGSNTSSISIDSLAADLDRPERFCGLHFFNPVYAMSLLEVVTGSATSPATLDAAMTLAARLGKEAITVHDAPGFATSRLGNALGLEAMRMVESGVASAADIDKAMVLGYRHPMGPLELSDVVGLDVRLDICRTLAAAYGERFAPPPLLVDMVADGKLGKKTGEGFYRWSDGKKVAP